MSLEGYKPLDLSSLQLQLPPLNLNTPISTGNIARTILANTNWNLPVADSLGANGKAAPHKKSFLGRIMDALSIGNYSVADASLDALKAHQSSSNDSVVSDILKSIAGGDKGVLEGIGASLKGTFGNDATANDPTGKNHFGDVFLQAQDRGRAALDPSSDMPIDQRKDILKRAYIGGIPSDIVFDPLNLVGLGEAKDVARIAEAGKIGEEAVQKAEQIASLSDKFKNIKNVAPEIKAKPPLPVGSPINKLSGEPTPNNTFDPETFDFVSATSDLPSAVPNASASITSKLGGFTPPKSELPKSVSRLGDSKARQKIAGVMLQDAFRTGDWSTVRRKLSVAFPGMDLTQTNKYLDHLSSMPKSIEGLKRVAKNRINFVGAIDRVLEHDFNRAGRVSMPKGIPATSMNPSDLKIPSNISTLDKLSRAASDRKASSSLKDDESQIFSQIVKKYRPQIETGLFGSAKNSDHLIESIAKGHTVKWSGPKQINMWQTILNRLPFSGAAKYNKAYKILRAVEDSFIAAGHTPYSAAKTSEAIPLRLTDVIQKIGIEHFVNSPNYATTLLRSALAGGEMSPMAKKMALANPDLAQKVDSAVGEARAANAVTQADAIKHGIDTGASLATAAKNSNQSEARIAEDINLASKTAKDIAKINGAGPVGSSIAGQILRNIFIDKTPVETAINKSMINTKAALSSGKLGKFNNAPAVTHAIQRELQSPSPHSLGMQIGVANRALDWLAARFNTAYKNPDITPIYNAEISTARSSVVRRAAVFNKATKDFGTDTDLWDRAYLSAQGRFEAVQGSPEHGLGQLIRQNFENLAGSSGLRAGAELENSVVGRAQLLMKELNASLRRYGITNARFTNAKKVKDPTGAVHDYSKGIDWLHSWESWKITDPLHFMMRMQNAIENTVHEANVLNEIAARWGRDSKIEGHDVVVKHPRLEGFYFTPEYASQINTYLHNLEEMKKPNSKVMRQFDSVLSKWKSSVTIYMPSHHVRNVIGDTYMNWLAGVDSVKPYSIALKIMRSQKNRYDSIEDVGKLTSAKSVLEAIERMRTGKQAGESGTNIALTLRNGQRVTNDMVYTAMFQKGLLPNARILEDLTDDSNIIERFRPLGGKGQAFFQHASEYREHFIRIAHFVDVLKKSHRGFPDAVEEASAAVRKWHPDGLDLTKFERNVMRRIFPFYSWTRKAIPLVVESLVMAPGKVVLYPKVMGGLSEGLTGSDGTADPFPTDQLFPQWIRDKGIGPVLGSSGSYTIINPSNPTLDLASQFGSPKRGIGSMLNPLFRIPAEELTGTQMATGAPVDNQADYLTNQIPGISNVGRVTNIGIGGPTAKWDKQGGPNVAALINLLFAAGVLQTGPYQKQAQFELRDYLGGK